MDNNLGSIIKNDKARSIIYAVWFIGGIAIGAAQVGFPDPDPIWLTTTFNVWSYLGVPVAALASANSHSSPNVVYAPDANVGTVNSDQTIFTGENPEGKLTS